MQSGSDCGFKCLLVVEQLTVRGIGQLPIIDLGLNEASKPPLIWINLVKVEVYSANAAPCRYLRRFRAAVQTSKYRALAGDDDFLCEGYLVAQTI